jgi:hypothetical protein
MCEGSSCVLEASPGSAALQRRVNANLNELAAEVPLKRVEPQPNLSVNLLERGPEGSHYPNLLFYNT